MPSLRKIPFTKSLPAGAEIFTKKGQRYARWTNGRGKVREAELTEDGQRLRLFSKKWYGDYIDAEGRPQCVPLATEKTAAGQMLAELVRKAELGKVGIVDPFEQHRKRTLRDHVADFEKALLAKGGTIKQARQVAARLRRVLSGCFFFFSSDISASRTLEYLASLRQNNLVSLDTERDSWTKGELAAVLGVKPHNLPPWFAGMAWLRRGRVRRGAIPAKRLWPWLNGWRGAPACRRRTSICRPLSNSAAGWSRIDEWRTTRWPICLGATSGLTAGTIGGS